MDLDLYVGIRVVRKAKARYYFGHFSNFEFSFFHIFWVDFFPQDTDSQFLFREALSNRLLNIIAQ